MVQGQRGLEQKTRTEVMQFPRGMKSLKGGAQHREGGNKLCFNENLYLNTWVLFFQ